MKVVVLMITVLDLLSLGNGAPNLFLTSVPTSSRGFCQGPVTFTCVGTEISATLFWLIDETTILASYSYRPTHTYPFPLMIRLSLSGASSNITSLNMLASNTYDIMSTLRVRDVSVLNGLTLHCEESFGIPSNTLDIEVTLLTTPPSPSSTSCSLLPSPGSGGVEVSLQWSPSFTSQYAVERYRVSVNPDPSSCSSEQVSPSEDYSCSGLVLRTLYTFTVSAINCGDQEGNTDMFTVQLEEPQMPADVEVNNQASQIFIQWKEVPPSISHSQQCIQDTTIQYTVVLVDSTGVTVEQKLLTSNNCSAGLCSTSISRSSLEKTCLVSVRASNTLNLSNTASIDIAGVRLTLNNQVTMIVGVVLLCVAIAIWVCLIIWMAVTRKGLWLSLVLLVVGCVLIVVSVVMWLVVAFYVGLQQNTCDYTWQTTRNTRILSATSLSSISCLILVADLIFFAISQGKSIKDNSCFVRKPEESKKFEDKCRTGESTNESRVQVMEDNSLGRTVTEDSNDYTEAGASRPAYQTVARVQGESGEMAMKKNPGYGLPGTQGDIAMNTNQVYGLRKQERRKSGSEISTEANLLYGLRQDVSVDSKAKPDQLCAHGVKQAVLEEEGEEGYVNEGMDKIPSLPSRI